MITSFTVVAGANAGGFISRVVLIVGISSVLADGLSMGVSEYLSSDADRAKQRIETGGVPQTGRRRPILLGLACFSSFVSCGSVPIVVYLLSSASLLSCAMFSLVELMLLGAARTWASREPLLWGVVQTAFLGAAAGGVAYGVGRLVDQWMDAEV